MTSASSTEPASRQGLSRERILDAAEALLSAGQPFTMRGIAERLDVTAMALYRWFANKDELLTALTERIGGPSPAVAGTDGPWADRALRFAIGIRRGLLAHLPLLQIEGAGRRLAANVYLSADEGLRLMLELGYRDRAAVDTYRVLFWSVLNHCLVIDATDAMPAIATPGQVTEQVIEEAGDELLERMPTLAGLLEHFTAVDADEFFERSMRVVIAGIEAGAPNRRR
ncbi:MAG: TetR/AcrR family transcriptional regulator [Acidimicrobiales bacterium]